MSNLPPAFWIIVGAFAVPLVKVLGELLLDVIDDAYFWCRHKFKGGRNGQC